MTKISATARDLLHRTEEIEELPNIDDLAARLKFSPQTGHIWLDDRRMVLMHTSSLGTLRRELIDTLGIDKARSILTRVGYASGSVDAALAAKIRAKMEIFDVFAVGPQLHALEGIVKVECSKFDVDVEKGIFHTEYLWFDSFEDEIHIDNYGIGADPVCWMQIGYASGFSTIFVGRPILFREVECRAMGQQFCRIIGKPADEWDNAEEDMRHMRTPSINFETQRGTDEAPQPAGAGPRKKKPAKSRNKKRHNWNMVGASAAFNVCCHMLERVADTDATVLFLGESGVGKEMFARNLHLISDRKDKPFIAVNCAAIPRDLFESELFGVEKGAYTGASTSKPGRFERADSGTLFLDEVGALPMSAQGKLLRALQEGEIERVGDTRVRNVDVRIAAATNIDLVEAVEQGTFREDLYYRLNVFPITIPPLRERKPDISLLLEHFILKFNDRHRKDITGLTERAIVGLINYRWPGNIRELENMIERGVILAANERVIDIRHLFTSGEKLDSTILGLSKSGTLNISSDNSLHTLAANLPTGDRSHLKHLVDVALETNLSLKDIETQLISSAVEKSSGNLAEAARALGMSRPQLAYRLGKINE